MILNSKILKHSFKYSFGLNEKIIPFYIIIIGVIYKLFLSFALFGGGDATNAQSFYLINEAGINLYDTRSPWPYYPLTVIFLEYTGQLSNLFGFDAQHGFRFSLSVIDLSIGYVIFSILLKMGHSKRSALLSFGIYTFNPLSSLIVSTLGFIDTACLGIMMLISMILMNKSTTEVDIKLPLLNFLLALAISFKPIAIILLPYVMSRSSRPYMVLIYCTIFVHILNISYIIDYGYLSFLNINNYVFNKITSGHQLSYLALGSFSKYIPFFYLKLITIFGIIFTAVIAINVLRSNAFSYCATVFLAILVFRYNAHMQYFLWPLPFLFITHSSIMAWSYAFICTIAIGLNFTIWPANGGAFSFFNFFDQIKQFPLNDNFSAYYYDGFLRYFIQIILIFSLLYFLKFERVISSFKKAYLYLRTILKSINFIKLILHFVPTFFLLFNAQKLLFGEDLLFFLKFIMVTYAPILLSCILLSCELLKPKIISFYSFYLMTLALNFSYFIFGAGLEIFLWAGAGFYIVLLISIRYVLDELDLRVDALEKNIR